MARACGRQLGAHGLLLLTDVAAELQAGHSNLIRSHKRVLAHA